MHPYKKRMDKQLRIKVRMDKQLKRTTIRMH